MNGRAFTEKERNAGLDVEDFIGKACLASVGHSQGKDGNVYDNIQSVAAMISGVTPKPQVNESFVYEIVSGNKNWDRVPEWMREKIKTSPEYISINGGSNEAISDEATDSPF